MVAAGLGVAVQPYLQSMGLEQVGIQGDWVHRQLLIGAKDFNAVARPVRVLLLASPPGARLKSPPPTRPISAQFPFNFSPIQGYAPARPRLSWRVFLPGSSL